MKRIVAAMVVLLVTVCQAPAQEQFEKVDRQQAIFERGYIQVIGESESGQSRYRAKRAAQVIAQRNLMEVVQKLNLMGESSVQEGMLVSDSIKSSVKGVLQGAIVVGEEFDSAEGYARVAMRLNLHGSCSVYESISPVLQNPPAALKVPPMPSFQPATPPASEPRTFDGLIVLVKGTGFRPAMGNRIITESQEVLLEPSKVSSQVLIERGCGQYATTEEKAKALLSSWGCKSPLVVKCSRVERKTEAVVSVDDASMIFEQNQKTNMLSQAKVVFVL